MIHHQFGPSGLVNYELCARFEKEVEGEGYVPHPVAVEGTLLHAKVERRDVSNLDSNQVTMVENCLAYLDQHTKGYNVEQEILLDVGKRKDGTFASHGHADVVAVSNEKAVLIDWKFGFNPVDDVEDNLQGQCYAEGLLNKYPKVKEVVVHFYMARYADGFSHRFTRSKDADKIRLRIETIIARVKDEADYTPSTRACLYCTEKGRCPAVAKHALALAKTQTEARLDLDQIDKVSSTEITDPVEAQRALRIAELLEPWCAEIKANAKKLLQEGTVISGYDLKERRGAYKLSDPNSVYAVVQDEMTMDEFVQACSVSLSALQKLVSDRAPRGSKGLAKELLLSKLKGTGLLHETGGTLYLSKIRKPKPKKTK